MAAVIEIHELTANATTGVAQSTVRFKSAPSTTNTLIDAGQPLVIPPTGSDYSYVKKLRAYMKSAPVTAVSNLRWYSDGTSGFGTGVSIKAKNIGSTFGSHYDSAMSGGASLFTYTSTAPLDGDATVVGPFATPGYIGDIIELQITVASTAANKALTPETLTLAYDET